MCRSYLTTATGKEQVGVPLVLPKSRGFDVLDVSPSRTIQSNGAHIEIDGSAGERYGEFQLFPRPMGKPRFVFLRPVQGAHRP